VAVVAFLAEGGPAVTVEIPAPLAALLAEACGYHTEPDCEMCADAVSRRREWGWTDEQIADDVSLFLHNRPEWYRVAVERVEARRRSDPPPADLADHCANAIADTES
jgi:hypothetical protein